MDSYSIIIQGEGKGHFSQAMTFIDSLGENADIRRIYLGQNVLGKRSDYFRLKSSYPVILFFSPHFIRSTNRKGIRVSLSILLQLLLGPLYIFEAARIRILILLDKSKYVYNFYDPVGALALRFWNRNRAERVILSHHFYLSHPDFIHPHGMESAYFWLSFLNRFMQRSANTILAASFRKSNAHRKIKVIPPLIDKRVREADYRRGDRDLCYFLSSGYLKEILSYYARHPECKADIFVDHHFEEEIPDNVLIHSLSRTDFLSCMIKCKRIICTAGFDTAAEAFYLGIPVLMLPSENHYEQYCNALDAARTGMAYHLDKIGELDELDFTPVNNSKYRDWVNSLSNQE